MTNMIKLKVKSQDSEQHYKHKGKKSGHWPTL